MKNLCLLDIYVEEAYCYVPGSECEKRVKKITGQLQKDTETSPAVVTTTTATTTVVTTPKTETKFSVDSIVVPEEKDYSFHYYEYPFTIDSSNEDYEDIFSILFDPLDLDYRESNREKKRKGWKELHVKRAKNIGFVFYYFSHS